LVRRRRSRLPILVAGLAILVLATGLGFVYAGVNPTSGISTLLGAGASASPSTALVGTEVALASETPAVSSAPLASAGASGAVAAGSVAADPSATTAVPGASGSIAIATPASSQTVTPGVQTTIATAVAHGSRANKVVALTFDDGYSPPELRQILAILKREKVTATFFPYGWAVAHDPAGWHMVVAAGYPIGNHTLRHTVLTGVSLAQVYEEMTRGRASIDHYSGGTSGNFMRPPGGKYNAAIATQISKAGYSTIVMWDVDTRDWAGASVRTIIARAIRGTNGSIVLMHVGPPNTPKALPTIMADYKKRGFTFVTIPQLLGIS
jgi:peptidoglycan/xylan/chitin deacetylase (PgdA/CDA1 family)